MLNKDGHFVSVANKFQISKCKMDYCCVSNRTE